LNGIPIHVFIIKVHVEHLAGSTWVMASSVTWPFRYIPLRYRFFAKFKIWTTSVPVLLRYIKSLMRCFRPYLAF